MSKFDEGPPLILTREMLEEAREILQSWTEAEAQYHEYTCGKCGVVGWERDCYLFARMRNTPTGPKAMCDWCYTGIEKPVKAC